MNAYEIILKKRNGKSLAGTEIAFIVSGFTDGRIADEQMAAFLMAVYFQGMDHSEMLDLTLTMARSGNMLALSDIDGFTVDKHSTGGVGDTTTLVVAPLVAACGGIVAKMTGRELGHTGGTVDKLESIPGLHMEMAMDAFIQCMKRIGFCLTAQTGRLAPADKKIYALRNVTATVESIPLIAASIMSKKLAAGADGIVLDVKTGSGGFLKTYEEALHLAKVMVDIGEGAGKKTSALITGMEEPLGFAVGNALEVREAVDTLNGTGPEDLKELALVLGAEMLCLSGVCENRDAAEKALSRAIDTKAGLAKFREFVRLSGGDPAVVDDPGLLPAAENIIPVTARNDGVVTRINAREVGMAAKILGAGRLTKDDRIDPAAGVVLIKKIGDPVTAGEPLVHLHTGGNPGKIAVARQKIKDAFSIGPEPVKSPTPLLARVSETKTERFI